MVKKRTELTAEDFVMAIGLIVKRVRADAPREMRELNWTQKSVLAHLEKAPATSADLARQEAVKPQSMAAAIGLLEKMGFIEREPHPTDGRQMYIKLTSEGAAFRKRVKEAKETWISRMLEKLEKHERATLFEATEVMKRMVKNNN